MDPYYRIINERPSSLKNSNFYNNNNITDYIDFSPEEEKDGDLSYSMTKEGHYNSLPDQYVFNKNSTSFSN